MAQAFAGSLYGSNTCEQFSSQKMKCQHLNNSHFAFAVNLFNMFGQAGLAMQQFITIHMLGRVLQQIHLVCFARGWVSRAHNFARFVTIMPLRILD